MMRRMNSNGVSESSATRFRENAAKLIDVFREISMILLINPSYRIPVLTTRPWVSSYFLSILSILFHYSTSDVTEQSLKSVYSV